MSSNESASKQKAEQGETQPQQAEREPKQGTVLGLAGSLPQRKDGRSQLIQDVKGQELNMWKDVITGIDSKYMESTLQIVKKEEAFDFIGFIRLIEYQGFDRLFYIKHALTKMSVETFCKFAIIGTIRGSNFKKICDSCEGMPQDMINAFERCGFVKTPKKRTDFTILRNTACIPHWCAYWSLKAEVPKKVTDTDCHACIQFPGAASLPMSKKVRLQHLTFCNEFSKVLPGGKFNINIYITAARASIPITDIPKEILAILEVSSQTESYALTDEDVSPYSKAMVRKQN